jgi:hypothetical protein
MKSLLNIEVGQNLYDSFDPSTEYAKNLDLLLSADSYNFNSFECHHSCEKSDVNLLHYSPTYLHHRLWLSSGAQSPTERSGSTNQGAMSALSFQHMFGESSSSFNTFDSNHSFMDFNFLPPDDSIQISLPTASEVERTMEREDTGLETHGTQCKCIVVCTELYIQH